MPWFDWSPPADISNAPGDVDDDLAASLVGDGGGEGSIDSFSCSSEIAGSSCGHDDDAREQTVEDHGIPTDPPVTTASKTAWMRRLYAAGGKSRAAGDGVDKDATEKDGVEDLTEMMSNVLIDKDKTSLLMKVDEGASIPVKSASSELSRSFTKSFDRLLAKELHGLPNKKREEVNNELHGVFFTPKESPELITKALNEMEDEINSSYIPIQDKQAHIRAINLHNQYCHQRNALHNTSELCYVRTQYFRLRFLRAEQYNPRKAAVRYFRSLKVLHKYFGDDALTRQLHISDLTYEEVKYLKNGKIVQLLNSRDSVGRRIFVSFIGHMHHSLVRIRRRINIFLLYSVVAEDISAQKNGIVLVGSALGVNNSNSSTSSLSSLSGRGDDNDDYYDEQDSEARLTFDVIKGLPVNMSAVHLCVPNEPKYKFVTSFTLILLGKEMRSRSRVHLGSSVTEMLYSLQNFGITEFPLTHTGTIKTKNMKDFVNARTAIDRFRQDRCKHTMLGTGATVAFTTNDPPGTECPEMNCVIFGNTRKYKHHKGNLNFREMLQSMVRLEENKKGREASTHMTTPAAWEELNDSVRLPARTQNAMFINYVLEETSKKFVFRMYDTNDCWYKLLDPIELRSQISIAIRESRKHINKKQAANDGSDNTNHNISVMGLDPRRLKRFKKDDGSNAGSGRVCSYVHGCL